MAKKGINIWFLLGGLISIVGILFFFIDNTFSMWELTTPGIFGDNHYYLNAFGALFFDGEETQNWTEDGGTYLYAGIIIIAGAVVAFLSGFKNIKILGILGALAIIGGLGYFIYSHVQFFEDATTNWFTLIAGLAGVEPSEIIWGSSNNTSWRLGNGFFIVAAGGIISLVGLKKE